MKKFYLGFICLLLVVVVSSSGVIAQNDDNIRFKLAVAVVIDIVDGDTYDIEYVSGGEGLPTRIEPYLINTPNQTPSGPFGGGSSDCYGEEATTFVRNLLVGQTIWIEHQDRIRTTNFIDRLLSFIYLDSQQKAMLQMILLSQGLGRFEVEFPEETLFLVDAISSESNARDAERGLWSECE